MVEQMRSSIIAMLTVKLGMDRMNWRKPTDRSPPENHQKKIPHVRLNNVFKGNYIECMTNDIKTERENFIALKLRFKWLQICCSTHILQGFFTVLERASVESLVTVNICQICSRKSVPVCEDIYIFFSNLCLYSVAFVLLSIAFAAGG